MKKEKERTPLEDEILGRVAAGLVAIDFIEDVPTPDFLVIMDCENGCDDVMEVIKHNPTLLDMRVLIGSNLLAHADIDCPIAPLWCSGWYNFESKIAEATLDFCMAYQEHE